MASGQGKRSGAGRKSASGKSSSRASSAKRKSSNSRASRQTEPMDSAIKNEVILIGVFALAVFLFLCNFGIVGTVGNTVSDIMFGLLGIPAYIAPVVLFLAVAFGISNRGSLIAVRKLAAAAILFLIVGMVCDLMAGAWDGDSLYNVKELYARCSTDHSGGGVLAGTLAFLSLHSLSMVGTVLLLIVLTVICLIILTEKSFVKGVRNGGQRVYERTKEETYVRRERAQIRRQEQEQMRRKREEERRIRQEEKENEKILRMDKKVSGVILDTTLPVKEEKKKKKAEKEAVPELSAVRDDIHEIIWNDLEESKIKEVDVTVEKSGGGFHSSEYDRIHITANGHTEGAAALDGTEVPGNGMMTGTEIPGIEIPSTEIPSTEISDAEIPDMKITVNGVTERIGESRNRPVAKLPENENKTALAEPSGVKEAVPKKYVFPPLNLLQKGKDKGSGTSSIELKETAIHLQKTLATFGVKVTITDISQGPTVTRYELQPEQGVKVSKIVGLTDDIKLNLAATDIRVEAPIPGKAAVGIEVPNKENSAVALRDLLESREFKEFPSNVAFAVGKDIGGKTVVADIEKMPHMLIAGSTGSGKSVCINTLIMSILYKAHPDDVKLIMVDPKVVELSVYNGIPHLLIPVVTDPKKAAAALHWGVAEMNERYKKFADFNVRNLKGYNKTVEAMREKGENAPAKMPQIVIIVDELADLMMVAPGEVEESICRLAQLARAAGIHLIIATQRPSVDVITGLIKANMPSRVAFAVSSGVDSRTILDMNGAEKLLGKGDMLFYPQGYPKPARIQGAFVSDTEVSDVVDFLKNQAVGNVYSEDVQEKIQTIGTAASSSGGGNEGSGRDQYFNEAGKFIIEKDKASIGMLQRVYKIGFNRAARIMDQLCEAGVVGEEEGTKPRKVLMSMEEFERFIEEEG
ncbi:MAG TPA: DNA translocase FtsK [Lachnospiraceae bacterium]|nr:DNA translocase FtsK [Lachnospiraceae bacterium]